MEATLSTVFMGITAAIAMAGIPWGYSQHGRLARIEERLHAVVIMGNELVSLREIVKVLELKMASVKRKSDS